MIEIAVCDDDANDLDYAVNILHEIFTAQNIGYHIKTFLSANEMLNDIRKIDIGILDIAMNELNGIKLGRKLKEKFPNVKLIYITSYEEYCMQAINDVHAFSFLCKPLDSCKMQKQIIEVLNGIPNNIIEKEFYKVTDSKQREYASIKLKLEDILYFEYIKRQRKAEIVLTDETYECECVFEKLVEELQQYDFVVNCRGNLVNLSHIEKIKGFSIFLDNGKELQIAQKRIVDFRTKMNEFLQRNS
ncbi:MULTISPECIES: LytR/AlgR family response regulator transcription factor [Bacillota]|jgi:DNA-binding LytR/AlgR family response regulator|uniref:LytR/AlgR family response regulator transcription factor n=1 Tax=Bacillota TaxID=1239 RepID=UPI0024307F8E|nr:MULTISPECIES: LytTR family DNA-binding domain-containing protein [Bacillota]